MNEDEKIKLALEVFQEVLERTDDFESEEDHIGSDLAYLMAAILKGTHHGFEISSHNKSFVGLLSQAFEPKHQVWKFIIGNLNQDPRY